MSEQILFNWEKENNLHSSCAEALTAQRLAPLIQTKSEVVTHLHVQKF